MKMEEAFKNFEESECGLTLKDMKMMGIPDNIIKKLLFDRRTKTKKDGELASQYGLAKLGEKSNVCVYAVREQQFDNYARKFIPNSKLKNMVTLKSVKKYF